MALDTQLATNAQAAALNAVAALLNNGYLRIYDGAKPATANDAITGVLLAELRFDATAAFATTATAVATANAIDPDTNANATGAATHFRCLKSDGTTAVFDGTVGTAGANLNLNSVAIAAGATVTVDTATISIPASGL